jgi:hypothetical protein
LCKTGTQQLTEIDFSENPAEIDFGEKVREIGPFPKTGWWITTVLFKFSYLGERCSQSERRIGRSAVLLAG